VGGWVQHGKPGFPLGTLVVNLSGCLAIGFLAGLFSGPRLFRYEDLRVALLIGVLGGYTTFSSFGLETINLSYDRQYLYAALNILLSVVLGLTAVWAGKQVVGMIYGS
jgi:fluoride exporter